MATPSEKLAESLEALAKLQRADGGAAIRARVKGGVKVNQCGGVKVSHLWPEILHGGIAGARASGA